MAIPTLVSYSDSYITISWTPLSAPANGNSNIIAYNLQWNSGSGSTYTDLTSTLSTTYTISVLTGGLTYLFQVRAKNIYDFGPFSPPLTT